MKYRKKPVTIDAWEFPGLNAEGGISLIDTLRNDEGLVVENVASPKGEVFIRTLEGVMAASPGDFIVRGVKGEFYPVKPDIFAATYDRAETIRTNDPETEETR